MEVDDEWENLRAVVAGGGDYDAAVVDESFSAQPRRKVKSHLEQEE